ncbi:MAG TPA: alpha/beta hydrolase [Candidatus Saccharimonadales bacterium]|nr:alpha/beta hydrolase [Candidatus Saccharimonadales bacterium]
MLLTCQVIAFHVGDRIRTSRNRVAKAVLIGDHVPTRIMHGDDDQIVPIGASAMLSSKIVKGARLKVYKGAPYGLCTTHKTEVNADLLAFLKS